MLEKALIDKLFETRCYHEWELFLERCLFTCMFNDPEFGLSLLRLVPQPSHSLSFPSFATRLVAVSNQNQLIGSGQSLPEY